MKHPAKTLLSLFLALTLALAPAAQASKALGWELHRAVNVLGDGVTLTTQTFWGDSKSDYRVERFLTYAPGGSVTPRVVYGATVPSRANLTRMARDLEEQGCRVLGGINGDYYVMATGVPLGMVVTDGLLRSSASYHYALGFRADGSLFVGKPELGLWADFRGYHLSLSGGYNKSRDGGGYTLFNSDFGAATGAKTAGVDVILRPVQLPQDYAEPEKPVFAVPSPALTDPAAQTGEPVPSPEPTDPAAQTGEPAPSPEPTDPAAQTGEPTPSPAPTGPAAQTGEPTPSPEPADPAAQTGEPVPSPEPTDSVAQTGEPTPSPAPTDPAAEEAARAAYEEALAQWRAQLAAGAAALESADAALAIGGTVECVVEQVVESAGSTPIPAGRFVLSVDASATSFLTQSLRELEVGERVTLSVTAQDARWSEAQSALGAYEWILRGGEVPQGLDASASPRTAVGIRADGSALFYTIDGRQPGYSVGATVTQVAQRLLELGCVDAVLLDGGGSTTLGVTGAMDEVFSLANRPSEKIQRSVTNAVFLVSDLSPTGEPGSLYLTPQDDMLLAGARTELSASYIDTGYYPMPGGPAAVFYTVDGPGTVEGSTFTAGVVQGETVVTGWAGELSGAAHFTVIATPHAITLADQATGVEVTSLNLLPGETRDLTARASWYKLPLLSQDDCFTWSCDETLGSIDENGVLTVGLRGGSGAVRVSAGDKTVTLPVTVAGHVDTLEDCEAGIEGFASGSASLSADGPVKFGYGSLTVSFPVPAPAEDVVPTEEAVPADGTSAPVDSAAAPADGAAAPADGTPAPEDGASAPVDGAPAPEGGASAPVDGTPAPADGVTAPTGDAAPTGDTAPTGVPDPLEGEDAAAVEVDFELALPEGDDYFGFWLWGDGAATRLEARVRLTGGEERQIFLYDAPVQGWKQLLVPLPGGAEAVTGLVLFPGRGSSGQMSFDQFIAANDAIYDTQPPQISLRLEGDRVVGTVSDHVDKTFDPARCSVTLDGAPLEFTLTGNALTAALPASTGGMRRVSAEVSDASGNRARASLELPGDATRPSPFGDTAGHWSAPYADYLFDHAVTYGVIQGETRYYNPRSNITRAEFAAMLCRWLGEDTAAYAGTALPFVDAASIPSWALEGIRTLYAKGIMVGSPGPEGPLIGAGDTITRAQVMTMLGRAQAKGYPVWSGSFLDDDQIPSWAREYVYTLTGQGVVSGYAGYVRPQDPITRGEVAKLLACMW